MSNLLSSDLTSLKIDREVKSRQGSPLRATVGVLLVLAIAVLVYVVAEPYLAARFFKTQVEVSEIVQVSAAHASIELSSSGYVVPQVRSQVGARVPGRVAKLFVKEGERVEAGQVLIRLERADQLAAIQSAKLRVATARARVAAARADLQEANGQAERERALVARGAAAQARAEDLSAHVMTLATLVSVADAGVASAEAELQALNVNLDHMTIVAPIAGTVLNKPPEPGEVIGNDFGIGTTSSGTIELVDFASLSVETDVPEGRLHLVKLGAPCEIVLDAYPQRRYRGEALEIMPRVNRAKASVGVKVKFLDAPPGVLPDMSARVSFLAKALDAEQMKATPKTIVEASAVADRGGAKVVFVVEGDTVRMKPVSLGPAIGDGFELQQGPEPGTKVVKAPPATLEDGQQIKERTAS
jgi:RND family efflux transporter MFP subunit